MPRLVRSLNASGLQVLETVGLRQQQPYWRKHPSLEKVLMKLTPIHMLLVCAHKVVAKSVSPVAPMPLPLPSPGTFHRIRSRSSRRRQTCAGLRLLPASTRPFLRVG
jgi:hypothetical protein